MIYAGAVGHGLFFKHVARPEVCGGVTQGTPFHNREPLDSIGHVKGFPR